MRPLSKVGVTLLLLLGACSSDSPVSSTGASSATTVEEADSGTTAGRAATAEPGDAFCTANAERSFSTNEVSNEMANYDSAAEAEQEMAQYRDLIEKWYLAAPLDIVDYMGPFYEAIVEMTDLAAQVGYDNAAFSSSALEISNGEGVTDSEAIYKAYVAIACGDSLPPDTLPGSFCATDASHRLCTEWDGSTGS